jgi:hypothetical protein
MALDFLTTTKSELVNLDSSPMRNMFATVGYVWPVAHQQRVWYIAESNTQAVLYIDGTPGDIEIHIRMQWRCALTADIKKISVHRPMSARPKRATSDASEANSDFELDMEGLSVSPRMQDV